MKFTCTSWSWSLLAFEDVVDVMSRMFGLSAIDVGAFPGWAHFEPEDLVARPQDFVARLDECASRFGVQYTDMIMTFKPDYTAHCVNDPDPAIRAANVETFKSLCEFCVKAKIPGMTLLPGIEYESLGHDASVQLSIDGFTPLAAIAKDAGLRISFEPHVGSITQTPEDALKVVKAVDHLTFTLDYAHFACQGYRDEQVHPLLEYTGHYHMRQARKGENQCRTNEGTIDFDAILTRLNDLNYTGWCAYEYVWEQWEDNDRVDVMCETLTLKKQLAKFED